MLATEPTPQIATEPPDRCPTPTVLGSKQGRKLAAGKLVDTSHQVSYLDGRAQLWQIGNVRAQTRFGRNQRRAGRSIDRIGPAAKATISTRAQLERVARPLESFAVYMRAPMKQVRARSAPSAIWHSELMVSWRPFCESVQMQSAVRSSHLTSPRVFATQSFV